MAERLDTSQRTPDAVEPAAGRRTRVDAAVRALLVVVAVAALLLGAPTAVTTVLSAAAVAAVAQRLAARGRGAPDTVLVATGSLLATLVVTGLALDLAGVPLERRGWALALGAVGLTLLGVAAVARPLRLRKPDAAGRRREVLRAAPWTVLTLAVVVVAVSAAVQSTRATDSTPLQVGLTRLDGGHVQVTVAAEQATGPLELRTDSGAGATLSYPLFRLAAGGSRVTDVLLPPKGRTVITVSNPGQTRPLRTLVVDR